MDCALRAPDHQRNRGLRAVGTLACHTSITGGVLLRSTVTARLAESATTHRLPWSHYLARPGRLELLGKADPTGLAEAFTSPAPSTGQAPTGGVLDLAAVGERALDAVQASPRLDRRPPLRAGRTHLRWAATVSGTEPAAVQRLRWADPVLRTVVLRCPEDGVDGVAEFCADLALHDWLLTTVLRVLDRCSIGSGARADVLRRLAPAVEHLLHLWMPAARGDGTVDALWDSLERRPGLDRQWRVSVDRIRDQLTVTGMSRSWVPSSGSGR